MAFLLEPTEVGYVIYLQSDTPLNHYAHRSWDNWFSYIFSFVQLLGSSLRAQYRVLSNRS